MCPVQLSHSRPLVTDLIHPEDYASDPEGRRVRFRIRATTDGVSVLGDAMSPTDLEKIPEAMGACVIEQTLCG
jgi:FtsH ternary system-associated peptide